MLSTSLRRTLLVLFFLSGFAALLYQVAWQRMLVFYTGSDTVSISLIVTAFMSGLGLGYLAGGRMADKGSPRRNLYLFILAELGILLFAAFSKFILYDLLYLQGPSAEGHPLLLYIMVFGALLIPTFLMGVSLPLLSRAYRLEGAGEQAAYISKLYFVNTLGASLGALLTGLFLVRMLGYQHALWVGVACNAVCAIGALVLGARTRDLAGPEAATPAREALPRMRLSRRLLAWCAQYFLSGFAALSLELIWFRVLGSLIKSVSITFSILLAIYLGSMAIGTAIGVRWAKGRSSAQLERFFLRTQALLYAYVGISFLLLLGAVFRLHALDFLWEYFKSYEPDLSLRIVLPTYTAVPLFLMFVPTFLMGLSFAVSQALIQDRFEEVGRKVGLLQFVNIVGSALGAWCVTWIGFNVLGTGMLVKCITALALLYLVVLLVRRSQHFILTASCFVAVLVVIFALPANTDFWRRLNGIQQADRFLYDENESGLSIVKRMEVHGHLSGVVFANGLGQSSMPYHRDNIHTALGALPVLLHPKPVDVAVIGFGSGGTLYGTAARLETERLVCFEIMSNQTDVIGAYARQAGDRAVSALLSDPRLHMIFHDGRYQLRSMPDAYDVIEADALRPNSSFSGNIYSKEYFELLRARLKPGGIAVSWCPTPRVFETMRQVFPYLAEMDGFIGIGSNEPIEIDWEAVEQRASAPFTQAHFAQAGIDISALLAEYEGSFHPGIPATDGTAEINTDLFPRDEFNLPYPWQYLRKKLGLAAVDTTPGQERAR
ncbi:MAG TPA: fused MFS/spermidine synthase [Flavobacteriales bacterium]|nr:fused MFS/spermidine synthase [Flavobacteriales bacterium]